MHHIEYSSSSIRRHCMFTNAGHVREFALTIEPDNEAIRKHLKPVPNWIRLMIRIAEQLEFMKG